MKKKDETTKFIKPVYERFDMLCPMCCMPLSYTKREGEVCIGVRCPHCGVGVTIKEAEERDEAGVI